MMLASASFLDALNAEADRAEAAETQYRKESARQLAALEQARAFAYRRLNLMRAVAGAMASAEEEDAAVAAALAAVREKLGWSSDSDARAEVLSRFAPVAQAVFRALDRPEPAHADAVQAVLAAFEDWYAASRQTPFWALFEQYVMETPRVDF